MAQRADYAVIGQAREVAERASHISGSPLPVMDFLATYGKFLNVSALDQLGQLYIGVFRADFESRGDYMERLLAHGLDLSTGAGNRYVTTIVGRQNARGETTEFRTIKTLLSAGEDYADLQNAIRQVLNAWQRNSNVQGFVVLDPVWRID